MLLLLLLYVRLKAEVSVKHTTHASDMRRCHSCHAFVSRQYCASMQAEASAPTQSQAAQEEGKPTCRECGHAKSQDQFVRDNRLRRGFRKQCTVCFNAAKRDKYKLDKENQVSMCMPFGIFVSVVCGSLGLLSGVGLHVFAGAAKGQHDMS